jgi:D-alanyl-D-alanine dipeptidase
MRGKSKGFRLIVYLIITLSHTITAAGQQDTIPHNQYNIPVITTTRQYRNTVRNDTSKRMVAVKNYVKPLVTDWKYATTGNFTKIALYKKPAAYLRLDAAKALELVQEDLASKNLGLKFFDAYRPYSVTEKMWKVVPDDRYAANPARGSGHNRGAAMDVTLVDLATGEELPMPTAFDDFTEKAHHNYQDLDSNILRNRALLKTTMEKHGFLALDTEWWHYFLPNAKKYDLMDLSFRQMKRMARRKRS